MTDEEMAEKLKSIRAMMGQEDQRLDGLGGSGLVWHQCEMLGAMEWLVETVEEQRKRLREAGIDNSATME